MNILHIDSSILGEGSVSRQLTASVVEQLTSRLTQSTVTHRDLAAQPLAHLSGVEFLERLGTAVQATPAQQAEIADGKRALAEFLAADVVVVGAPMYNFSVPSQLRAWMDRVAVAGQTFRYTASGPEGLAGGKRVIAVVSRGGFYGAESPSAGFDFQERYLTAFFAFLGIQNVEFIRAEGIAMGPESRAKALDGALSAIKQLA